MDIKIAETRRDIINLVTAGLLAESVENIAQQIDKRLGEFAKAYVLSLLPEEKKLPDIGQNNLSDKLHGQVEGYNQAIQEIMSKL